MLLADQLEVPLAVPLPPRLLDQVTRVTPTASEAVPLNVTVAFGVVYVEPEVGLTIVIAGAVVSLPVNVAVTFLTADIATVQLPVPGHEIPLPPQLLNVAPLEVLAVNVTDVPLA